MLPLFPSFSPFFTLQITTIASEKNASYSKSIPPEQAYDIGKALIKLQEQVRKLNQGVEQGDSHNETLTNEAMKLAPLNSHTLPLMKTLMIRTEELEEEDIQGMTLEISKLSL